MESNNPTDAIIFFGIALLFGIITRQFLRGTKIPYTVALLLIGLVLGSLDRVMHHHLGKIGNGIRIWSDIDPDLLLAVFLPALLFESSFSMDVHLIKSCMVQMLLLAGPGVLMSTFIIGSAVKLELSFLLGGLLSATDPVAVLAMLKELGASKKLCTIIEGESIMNDGMAIVVYNMLYQMINGWSFKWGTVIKFFAQESFGGVGIGLAFGLAVVLWLGFIYNDMVIEITLTVAMSYIAYFTAQEGVGVSGILAVMALGMLYAALARTAFKGFGQQSLHHFWEMVAYVGNTLVFILSGIIIAEAVLGSNITVITNEYSWGYLVLLYVYLQLTRAAQVGLLYPALRFSGYGLTMKEATVLAWSGLRGPVALSLALSVQRSRGDSSSINFETGNLFVFYTSGMVFLSIIVNGSTAQLILYMLNMYKQSTVKRRRLDYVKNEMLNKALEAFSDLGDDEQLGPVDWPSVRKDISCLNDVDGESVDHHNAAEADSSLECIGLCDIRVHFLNGVQAAYYGMLNEGSIAQSTFNILMQSVDEVLDLLFQRPLCDWNGLKAYVSFPIFSKFFNTRSILRNLGTSFTIERLESGCYICVAFLRAHKIARQQLYDLMGDTETASTIISESVAEGEEAKKFLDEVLVTFPQVLRVLKKRQATYSVLRHLIDYIENLEKVGFLEERDLGHLHDAVQTDLKKLLRNPPFAKYPEVGELVGVNPLLGALPAIIREQLVGSSKETIKQSGVPLYREGSKPNGIWLVFNGVVKWESKNPVKKHSLHPTFSHGSTLGLYEVLNDKPYICDIITDSVVLCIFIEAEKILSVLGSDPAVEEFLWQESAIVLSRLMLPEIFEEITMRQMRALVAKRSTMSMYTKGERIQSSHDSIGFLLEGHIKVQDRDNELITSPAALLPSYCDRNFQETEVSGAKTAIVSDQSSYYVTDTRARVIMFDVAGFEGLKFLERRVSSSISHAMNSTLNPLIREPVGLTNWPEHFHKTRQDHEHPKGSDQQVTNLAAKAMQLSIYGTLISDCKRRRNALSSQLKAFPSSSYPRESLGGKTPILPVQSSSPRHSHHMEYSSDHSAGMDEPFLEGSSLV